MASSLLRSAGRVLRRPIRQGSFPRSRFFSDGTVGRYQPKSCSKDGMSPTARLEMAFEEFDNKLDKVDAAAHKRFGRQQKVLLSCFLVPAIAAVWIYGQDKMKEKLSANETVTDY